MYDDTLQLEAFRELDPALTDCLLLVTPSSPKWPREALCLLSYYGSRPRRRSQRVGSLDSF